MTEEEVKTKWCFRKPRDPRDGATLHPSQCCDGSACMAWRWDGDKTDGTIIEERTIGAGEQYPAAPSGHRWRTGLQDKGHGPRPIALFARIGFCGLAGKP